MIQIITNISENMEVLNSFSSDMETAYKTGTRQAQKWGMVCIGVTPVAPKMPALLSDCETVEFFQKRGYSAVLAETENAKN